MVGFAHRSAVLRAEIGAYAKHAPILYIVAMSNTVTLAVSHYGLAPAALTVVASSAIVGLCAWRTLYWLLHRDVSPSDASIESTARTAVWIGAVVGLGFLLWLSGLWYYGNTETRAHVSVGVGATGVASVFGMMHVRKAAMAMASIVTVPYALFLLFQGWIASLIAINLLLVLAGAIYVLFVTSNDFRKMVLSQIETKRLGDENLRIANYDNLTGLPNRRFFFNLLDALSAEPETRHRRFAVGVLDLDGFKAINDLHGHAVGDQVLQEVAYRLRAAASDAGLVARLGGDEFGLVIETEPTLSELEEFGARLCLILREPMVLSGLPVKLSGSIGFALYPDAGLTSADLYERADFALYHVKDSGRGRTAVYTPIHEAKLRRGNDIEQRFREADLDVELYLHFQPVFAMQTRQVVAFEALARWHNPSLGEVSPGLFIPVAERSDLIHSVTHSLLRKALAVAGTWPDHVRISFNLSARDLMSPASMLTILSIVNASGVAPGRIEFEVTETALLADIVQAQASFDLLKALGVRIALDDFGTGYSSLSHVHALPLDKIKVDRSFVTDIETKETSRLIVRSVIDLCRNLQIDCVVEGAETEAQAEVLRTLGCHLLQGYLLGRPMPASAVDELLATTTDAPPVNLAS